MDSRFWKLQNGGTSEDEFDPGTSVEAVPIFVLVLVPVFQCKRLTKEGDSGRPTDPILGCAQYVRLRSRLRRYTVLVFYESAIKKRRRRRCTALCWSYLSEDKSVDIHCPSVLPRRRQVPLCELVSAEIVLYEDEAYNCICDVSFGGGKALRQMHCLCSASAT